MQKHDASKSRNREPRTAAEAKRQGESRKGDGSLLPAFGLLRQVLFSILPSTAPQLVFKGTVPLRMALHSELSKQPRTYEECNRISPKGLLKSSILHPDCAQAGDNSPTLLMLYSALLYATLLMLPSSEVDCA